jgi:hypothetical protein
MVSRHPGDRLAGQGFSLFINTLFAEEFALWPREMGHTQRSRRRDFRPMVAMGQGAFLLWWQLEPLR